MSNQETFRVNIFGVGRSGTKAVQLWLAYLLAKKHGEVWVNYEPLRYQSKSLGPNHWGWRIHRSLPMLADDNEVNRNSFRSFGNALVSHPVVVSKFIRATGRINLINSVTQPDLSILVVRDLYQVLQSVGRLTWNLFDSEKDWLRLHSQGIDDYPSYKKNFGRISQYDKHLTNATYWFLMNKHALDHLEDTIVVDYAELGLLEKLVENSGIETEGTSVRDPLFKGGRIHRQSPLEEIEKGDPRGLSRVIEAILPNKVSSELNARFSRRPAGSLCRINSNAPELVVQQDSKKKVRPEITVKANPLFDNLAEQVQESLSAALARQKLD